MNTRAIQAFHKKLHRWYAENGRHDLPWRNTRDPYHIYLSEIMLQQTQVKTVLERFYHPFLKRFPTLSALAKVPAQDVMKAWEGLGYYTRAANLHKAAKQSGGALPKSVDELLALPGIGQNTAHAIATFAFHQPVPVMEANVKRVLCRVFAITKPTSDELWARAGQLLDAKKPFDYNQAMMDIGAMVCTKRQPQCGVCPASEICQGKKSPGLYPTALKKKSMPVHKKYILVKMNAEGKIFLEKRTTKFLGGLFGFTEIVIPAKAGIQPSKKDGFRIKSGMTKLGHITQQYSHFTLDAEVYTAKTKGTGAGWHSLSEAQKLPLSRADLKVLALL